MTTSSPAELTQLLHAYNQGDLDALEQLTYLVDREMRKLAGIYLRREHANHSLQPTELANEAYLRLFKSKSIAWENRRHFFGVMATIMRHVLVDNARRKKGQVKTTLEDILPAPKNEFMTVEFLALIQAFEMFLKIDQTAAKVWELRYFCGLSEQEAADVLDISIYQVKRRYKNAKIWLQHKLS